MRELPDITHAQDVSTSLEWGWASTDVKPKKKRRKGKKGKREKLPMGFRPNLKKQKAEA